MNFAAKPCIIKAITGGNPADDNQTPRHSIQKRPAPPDILAAWQIPLFYKACSLGTKLGSGAFKKLKILGFGLFGKATAPFITPALKKKLLIGACPPASVLAWFFASGVNPAPGV